jgi:hypothetical protein
VNVNDSDACGKKLLEMVLGDLAVTVFAMQRGVRATSDFKEMFTLSFLYVLMFFLLVTVSQRKRITLSLNVLLALLLSLILSPVHSSQQVIQLVIQLFSKD